MLFEDTIIQLSDEVQKAVKELFDSAFKNQSDDGDIFLILLHAFYNKENESFNRPYVFGFNDEVVHSEHAFYEFFDVVRSFTQPPGTRIDFIADSVNDIDNNYAVEKNSIHVEMLTYLKFWESDMIIKKLYQLVRLASGKTYDWNFQIGSRSNIVRKHIRDDSKVVAPLFYNLINNCYLSQMRNAIGHSQYNFMFKRDIGLLNFDGKQHLLRQMSFDEWELKIHYTVLLYNEIIRWFDYYDKFYIKQSEGKHNGIGVRAITPSGRYFWIFHKYEPDIPRWTLHESLPKK